jgi:hypothetical protein
VSEPVFPNAWVQTCIVHLIRQSLRFVPDKHRRQAAKDLKPIYIAVGADAAAEALAALVASWGRALRDGKGLAGRLGRHHLLSRLPDRPASRGYTPERVLALAHLPERVGGGLAFLGAT